MTSSSACNSVQAMLLWMTTIIIVSSVSRSEVMDSANDEFAQDEDFPVLVASSCLDQTTSSSAAAKVVDAGSTSSRPSTLDLRCPSRRMVRIVDLLYGHFAGAEAGAGGGDARTPRCHYELGDCVTHLPTQELDVPCVGRDVCSVTVPDDDRGRLIPGCDRMTTYVQASYQCIPESVVIDVCSPLSSPPDVRGTKPIISGRQRGFLRTPGYPTAPYSDSVDCELTIEAPHAFQKIRLDAIDVELEKNGTGCADWLETFDGLQSMTLCVYPEVRAPVTSSTGIVTSTSTSAPIDYGVVEWPPDEGASAGGPSSGRVSKVAVSKTEHRDESIADKSVSFPLLTGSLAAVVIGLLACILVACIITIIVFRRGVCGFRSTSGHVPERSSLDVTPCYVVRLPPLAVGGNHDDRLLLQPSSTSSETQPERFAVVIDVHSGAAAATTLPKPGFGRQVVTPKSNAEKLRLRLMLQQQEQEQPHQQQLELCRRPAK